ncbi:MAG: type II secretion system protein [Patescibacteria group bacterium]
MLSSKNLQPTTYNLLPNQGFTVMELLVVMAVVGILYTVVMSSVGDSRAKGRDSKRVADLSLIQLALEGYYDDPVNKKYPTTLDDANLAGPIPKDPHTNLDYAYVCINSCQSYHLGATLEKNNTVLSEDEDMDSSSESEGGFSGVDDIDNDIFVYDVVPKF